MCVGLGTATALLFPPSDAVRKALVRGDQYTRRILSGARTTEREPVFDIDENKKSDFLNPLFLAECFLEQNLNYNSDPFPSKVQTRVTGYGSIN